MQFKMNDRPQDPKALCVACGKPVGQREGPFRFWDLEDRPVCETCAYTADPGVQDTFQVIGALMQDGAKARLLWQYATSKAISCHRFRGFPQERYWAGGYAEEPGRIEVDYVDRLLVDDAPVQVLIWRGMRPELVADQLEEIVKSIRMRKYAAPEAP